MGSTAAILVFSLVLVWFVLAEREPSDNVGTSQLDSPTVELAGQEEGSLADQGLVAKRRPDDLAAQSEASLEDRVARVEQSNTSLDVSAYFSNSKEYLETNRHWSTVFAADRLGWVDRLDELFEQPEQATALTGEPDLARRAVLEHPGYSYKPSISLSSLTAECRNMICKVDVAPNHKYDLVLDFGGRDRTTGLTPLDEVLFTNNFGHHVSKFDSTTGVLTHYLLVNGFDFR